MHHWRLAMAIGVFAAHAAGGAVIFKWTDADGVVHYSDQATPGAEKIVTSSGSSNGIGGATVRSASPRAIPAKTSIGLNFTAFAIESPARDQVFFGDEVVPVRLRLEPGLTANQTLTWHLNGKPLEDQGPSATSFALQALPRGVYAVAATVTDLVSGESQSTDSVTFNVKQPSALSPQHQKP